MSNVTQLSTSTDWPQDAIPKAWIEKLFDEMLMTFGKKFSDQWGGVDPARMKLHWARKMADLSGDEMKRGVRTMMKNGWPPTLDVFLALCRPPVDAASAFHEAVDGLTERRNGKVGTWSHPAIFFAAARMASDILSMSYPALKTRWEKALDDELAKGSWPEIVAPAPALPAPGKTSADKAEAKAILQKLGAGTLTAKSKGNLAWAEKILMRVANGEKLPVLSVKWAREAVDAAGQLEAATA
ncbi:MAG: hypothetical protein H6R01_450 [Burkholderiaceae bacterium]|nr:hypothetical protein [Burkholderiaceae bacterium]